VLSRVPGLLRLLAAIYGVMLALGGALLLRFGGGPTPDVADGGRDGDDRIGTPRGRSLCGATPTSSLPAGAKGAQGEKEEEAIIEDQDDDWWGPTTAILRRPEVYFLWITRFGVVLAAQVLSGLHKAFALDELDLGDAFVSSVGAAAGLFNCAGRVAFGFAIDKMAYK